MKEVPRPSQGPEAGKAFCTEDDLDFSGFKELCQQASSADTYPNARTILKKIPVYAGAKLREAYTFEDIHSELKSELYHCLYHGPGVFIIEHFYEDLGIVDASTSIFKKIIQAEKEIGNQQGDHFAAEGANERIWNSFQKVGEHSPESFIDYYKNPLYALVSEAWLGPGYQITAQVNIVKPGGEAQSPHRDYHLGFQDNKRVSAYPRATQVASQLLTLQGAIAHSDMPLASGPTLLLPFSQQYDLGYLAYRNSTFRDYFLQHAVQLPLRKGDALFFSPALFHGAGHNTTSQDRIANLIQVSSAFGKTMESIDRISLMKDTYAVLTKQIQAQTIDSDELLAIICATADGYPFPTNLDLMPPVEGRAPETGQEFMMRALAENMSSKEFAVQVNEFARTRRANS